MILVLLLLGIGIWLSIAWYSFLSTPLMTTGSSTIIIKPNIRLRQFAQQLKQQGLISNPDLFVLLARLRGDGKKLRMGEYAIDEKTTINQLLTNIVTGKVVMRKITFLEGSTFAKMRVSFANNSAIDNITLRLTDEEIMWALGHPQQSPEGRFFPDTYLFTWGNKDIVILQQAYRRMEELLAREWQQRAANLPYENVDQALIVASLIESETALDSERPLIAGVIIQRLRKKMYLQIDPTVLYGMHKPLGFAITAEDLHDENLYNTYRHLGLPPTAINMPSAASVHAALHPIEGDALYYVLQADGRHFFSATYMQHLQAVQKYRHDLQLKSL